MKTQETKVKSKEAEGATKVPKDPMKASFQADLKKAKKAIEDAQGPMTTAASEIFGGSTQICFLLRASTCGTRLSASGWKATHL